jgi:hypothetical protein
MYTKDTSSAELPVSRNSNNLQPSQDLVEYAKEYARQKPEVVALWCFGIGFIVGWKLKPW